MISRLMKVYGIGLLVCFVAMPLRAGGLDDGRKSYQRFCQNCHGNDGVGKVGRAPNFRRSEGLLKSNKELVSRIEKGKGICPSFQGILSEDNIKNVIRYLRTFR